MCHLSLSLFFSLSLTRIDIVDRMDYVIERCLSLDEQMQQHNVHVTGLSEVHLREEREERANFGRFVVSMEEVMRLCVALAGGEDGETFVAVDTVQEVNLMN